MLSATFPPHTGAPALSMRPTCPEGTREDVERAGAIFALLSDHAQARDAILGLEAICFGDIEEAGLLPDGTALLPAHASLVATAARAAHLGHHRAPSSPLLRMRRDDCASWIREALLEEERARSLEQDILRRDVEASPLRWERAEIARSYTARCTMESPP